MKFTPLFTIIIMSFLATSTFAGTPAENEISLKYCHGNCEKEISSAFDSSGPLSVVEQFVIEKYTESNIILSEEVLLAAALKLPSAELVTYRGASKASLRIEKVGQIIDIRKIISVSASQEVAEGFVKDQLMMIKAKSARDISHYSVVGEKELLLLPGTKLRVDSISEINVDLSEENEKLIRKVQMVTLTEI